MIAVITGEATRLPNSVLLATPLPHVTVGDEASVGDRVIDLGPLSLGVRRWWDPRRRWAGWIGTGWRRWRPCWATRRGRGWRATAPWNCSPTVARRAGCWVW
ncbi:hypothetical protein ACFQYP_06640 [Nonomuraea antimicrobica]